jgi:hypothetical protein
LAWPATVTPAKKPLLPQVDIYKGNIVLTIVLLNIEKNAARRVPKEHLAAKF